MSGKVKVYPSLRPSSSGGRTKYELKNNSDSDSGGPGYKVRRGSFSVARDPRDSPSVANLRRKSFGADRDLGLSSPSQDWAGQSPRTPRNENSGEGSGLSLSLPSMSPRTPAGSRKSPFSTPNGAANGRRNSLTSTSMSTKRKKVTFRNPLSDFMHADNTVTQSQIESADYSLGPDSEHSGDGNKAPYNRKNRRNRAKQPGDCCVIS